MGRSGAARRRVPRLDSGQKGKVCYGLQAALPTIRPMTASSPYTAAFRLSSI